MDEKALRDLVESLHRANSMVAKAAQKALADKPKSTDDHRRAELIAALTAAPRIGADADAPEGTRYVSEDLLQRIIKHLQIY